MTQQNAALVEQAAAAAKSMHDQAGSLSAAVSVFKLSQGAGRGGAPRPKPAARTSAPKPSTPKLAAAKPASLAPPGPPKTVAPKKLASQKTPSAAALRSGDNSSDWEEF